jgi:polyisoprenyl-phosphate glycosyltransferase
LKTISILIPFYQNSSNVVTTTKRLLQCKDSWQTLFNVEFVFVNDGSTDDTYRQLMQFYQQHTAYTKVVNLAGNYGSHQACLAGLPYCTGNAIVIIAADLQDPPELIATMYTKWEEGCKLILAEREKNNDPFFTRVLSNVFHKLLQKLVFKNLGGKGFDFVFFDKELANYLVQSPERNNNIMYWLLSLGYPYQTIPYTRAARALGRSQWTMRKRLKLFADTIVGFSYKPIRWVSSLGFILGFLFMLYGGFVFINKILNPSAVISGWTSTILIVTLIGSFQFIALGIIGEYVWRTLETVRQRPGHIVQSVNGLPANNNG